MNLSDMRAYATYINAGLRGSRLIGHCEVGSAGGAVWVTGHRMPIALVWVRSICYVLFVPWVLIALGAVVAAATRGDGWPYLVALAAGMFVVIAVGLGGGDIWATYRGPRETVHWYPAKALPAKRAFDQTASCGGLGPTIGYRLSEGRCVTKLRVPIGPKGKLRLLALRSGLQETEALAWVLAGVEGYPGVAAAPLFSPDAVWTGGHLPETPDKFCRKCGTAVSGGAFCGKCGSALDRYRSAQETSTAPVTD